MFITTTAGTDAERDAFLQETLHAATRAGQTIDTLSVAYGVVDDRETAESTVAHFLDVQEVAVTGDEAADIVEAGAYVNHPSVGKRFIFNSEHFARIVVSVLAGRE